MQKVIAVVLALFSGLAYAECGVNMSCTGGDGAILPPKACPVQACFLSEAAKKKYEQDYNCTFASSACGDFNADTQCCGKDPRTGNAKVVDKVMTSKDVIAIGADSFTWTNYLMTCPDKKQNIAPPNALWQQCVPKQKQTPEDPYEIVEVRKNGTARDYCIDGCSEPPSAVAAAVALGVFLQFDHDNPTGYSAASSFYNACATHDVCYQTCNNNDQLFCDTQLKNNSIAACQTIPAGHWTFALAIRAMVNTRDRCEKAAKEMFRVLSDWKFGLPAFNLRRQQYCQCC
ncbi:MAG: hypothetical protein Q7V00_13190 [Sulfurimicrobium sp.]|nr:hypothetical protein [Sulfurimicrobium sp.]MDP2197903.1 hypothetical protein [Sulfurimicrobium sp.]